MASTTETSVGNNLDHLTLHISSTVLDNAFSDFVSEGCYGAVYRVPHDGVLCAAKYQIFDKNVYKLEHSVYCIVNYITRT